MADDEADDGRGASHSGAAALVAPLAALGEANAVLRERLGRLRDELGMLFTTGRSDGLGRALGDLEKLPTASAAGRGAQLGEAVAAVPHWVHGCLAPGALPRYRHFGALREEVRGLELELRALGREIHGLREERARADGALAGLEERTGRQRGRRSGEEYELARYLGASLFHWDLLRTKVAHHLAATFTEAQEQARDATSGGSLDDAEHTLGLLEERLARAASAHKKLAERRAELGKQLRAFLKSLLLSCEAELGEVPPEAVMSKRFHVLRSRRLGVHVQAAEELARFLNGTFAHTLPQTVALLHEVLGPYAVTLGHGGAAQEYLLPTTWKARPKVGRWWEWLEEGSRVGHAGSSRRPVARDEFERRFAAAKRRFSVRISSGEPVVMGYLLWLLLEDALGAGRAGEEGSSPEPLLALPGPPGGGATNTSAGQDESPLVL